jgi:GTP-binding protein EngB required for normal cell division
MQHLARDPETASGSAALHALAKTLSYAIQAAQAAIGNDASLVRRLAVLRERVRDNRLQLAVLGQFKRGKSTFINALLGAPLLPVAVVPLTAVPVFIAWGQTAYVRVRFTDGRPPEELSADEPDAIRDFLFRFVAEEANPENRLGVSRVDLFYPAPLLSDGTLIIDTPGIGSTFRHNTEAALDVLPECDAALFVVSADPPITEIELEYLREVNEKAARIFYILNKIDYLGPDELERMAGFLRAVLEQNELWTPGSKIFGVSARKGLEGKQRGNREAFEASGMAAVEAHLIRQLATEKSDLLERAMSGHVRDGLAEAVAEVSLRLEALTLPRAELTSRACVFEGRLDLLEERQRTTRDVLAGEQRNLREAIERRVASVRGEACSELTRLLDLHAAAPGTKQVLSGAIERIFDAARATLVEEFSRRTDAVLAGYQERIDTDVDTVRRTAAEIFNTPFSASGELAPFTLRHEPYWVTQEISSSLIPDPISGLERLLPQGLRVSRMRARMLRAINELAVRNAENLRWALLRGIDETFRDAATDFQARVDGAVEATRGVIAEALARRRDKTYAIDADLERLRRTHEVLSTLGQQVSVLPAQECSAS